MTKEQIIEILKKYDFSDQDRSHFDNYKAAANDILALFENPDPKKQNRPQNGRYCNQCGTRLGDLIFTKKDAEKQMLNGYNQEPSLSISPDGIPITGKEQE